jgi:hypothetical protein
MSDFSDFIIYADESGDHGLGKDIDPNYPIFALVFCIIRKKDFIKEIVTAIKKFKFDYWGHDAVILHEREIHKSKDDFAFLLTGLNLRERFYNDLNKLIEAATMKIAAAVIDKIKLQERYKEPWNPYEIALYLCMEQLYERLCLEKQSTKLIHIVFESRGKKEDAKLKEEFLKISRNETRWGYKNLDFTRFKFEPIFKNKLSNSTGLQLADLKARPIGISALRPTQPNRAMEIIQPKLVSLKQFP